MSLEITIPFRNTPIGLQQCDFFAAHNPIVVRVQRKDHAIATIDSNAGNIRLNLSAALAQDVLAGAYVYVNSAQVVGTYQVLTLASSGATAITLDEPWTVNTAGGFVNLVSTLTNYYVETDVLKYNAGLTLTSRHTLRPDQPDATGLMLIDVARNLRTLVNLNNDFNYSTSPYFNQMDRNASWKAAISLTEFWDGSAESPSAPLDLYVVNAAMQIQSRGGVCMVPYFPDNQGHDGAKFLSDMTQPKRWIGLPFDLSFIFSKSMHDYGAVKRYEELITAGSVSSTTSDALEMTQYRWVNRMLMKGAYASTVDSVDVFLGNPEVPALYYDDDYIDSGYYDDGDPFRFTEKIRVRLVHCLPKNPYFLAWKNKKGGWNYFCFFVRQYLGRKTSTDGELAYFPEDLENMIATHDFLNKSSEPYAILGAEQLDAYDIEGIDSLIDSPRVLHLTNPTTWNRTASSVPIWRVVRLDVGDYRTRDTRKTFNSIQFKIRLPELALQSL